MCPEYASLVAYARTHPRTADAVCIAATCPELCGPGETRNGASSSSPVAISFRCLILTGADMDVCAMCVCSRTVTQPNHASRGDNGYPMVICRRFVVKHVAYRTWTVGGCRGGPGYAPRLSDCPARTARARTACAGRTPNAYHRACAAGALCVCMERMKQRPWIRPSRLSARLNSPPAPGPAPPCPRTIAVPIAPRAARLSDYLVIFMLFAPPIAHYPTNSLTH